MSATTVDRNTPEYGYCSYPVIEPGVAASTKIPAGVMVALDTSGTATNASDAAGLIFAGVSQAMADNSSGGASAIRVKCKPGIYEFAAAAAYTAADVGKQVYVTDNQTVTVSSGAHNLKCGRLFAVLASGNVRVDTRPDFMANAASS